MASLGKWDSVLSQNQGNSGNQKGNQSQQPSLQGFGNLLSTLGLGAIKNIGADVYDIGKAGIGAVTGQQNLGFGPQYQNPFRNEQELTQTRNQQNLGGFATQEGKDIAGLASWVIPSTKVFQGGNTLTKILAGGANTAIQGGIQGGLSATSQDQANPQSILQGVLWGGLTNPALSGAGHLLTDTLPRYIGIRNFGVAGAKLPEVIQAENAIGATGKSLKEVRDTILSQTPDFNLNITNPKDPANRFGLMDKIEELANSDQYRGVPGISDLTKKSTKTLPQQSGELPSVISAIENSTDAWDAYTRLRNMADWSRPSGFQSPPQKLHQFYNDAASTARKHLIDTSANPEITQEAMDNYATQTAMNKAKSGIGGNKITNMIANVATGGGGEGGLAALSTIIPGLQGLTLPLAIDTALTNRVTGPPLARGLVNAGESPYGELLKRLGIGGIQGVLNLGASQ